MPAKFIFLHILQGSRHLTSNSPTHWIAWLSCALGIVVIAYITASAIPVFDSLASLVGSLLGMMMCCQPMGCIWLYDNWWKGKDAQRSKW